MKIGKLEFRFRRHDEGGFNDIDRDRIANTLRRIVQMSAQIDHLRSAVANLTSVTAGVEALLTDISDRLRAALEAEDGVDVAAAEELANDIDNNVAGLAAAVTANTPVAPPTPAPKAPPTEEGGATTTPSLGE